MSCGCQDPFVGASLARTCSEGSLILFMHLVDTIIRNTCTLSDICDRISPKTHPELEYDFVVIGGGGAGSVVAGRLAEIPNWTILLIEAGDDEPPGSQVPSMMNNYLGHPTLDWGYQTEPEPMACLGYQEKRCTWPRGKVLGGSGVLHGMMYLRGVPRDYDNWALAGNLGWSYKEVLPFFKKAEDNLEMGDGVFHGTEGPMTTSRFPHQPKIALDLLESAKTLGYPIRSDLNGAEQSGFTVAQANIRNGTRLSTASAYLRPAARFNPNLHIMLNSTATKVLITQSISGKRASGVEFIYNNKLHTVRVNKEVVISGGAVSSPQILLLSGIGPREELLKVGIQQLHELPGVGRNLQNHVSFLTPFILTRNKAVKDLNWDALLEYVNHRRGPMSSTGLAQLTARISSKYGDQSGVYPDLQFFFAGFIANCSESGQVWEPEFGKQIKIVPVVLHPKSVGRIGLKSKNPLSPPAIFANYLTEPEDVAALVDGVRVAQKLAGTDVMRNKYGLELVREEYGNCSQYYAYDSDQFWECAVRYATGPENHQVGSCKMGPMSDSLAVVDPQLQVHGINDLRVIDASVMPSVPTGNTYATVVMIAEKGVVFIKRKWLPM